GPLPAASRSATVEIPAPVAAPPAPRERHSDPFDIGGRRHMQKAALDAGETDSADRAMLLELNRNYVRSALESDVRWYAENLSEDFYITAPDGALLDRDAFLERIAKPYPGTEAEAVDVMIRILGDVAIIHSGFRDKRLTGETGYGRYTDIYERRNGRWLCVAAHFMRFQTPPRTYPRARLRAAQNDSAPPQGLARRRCGKLTMRQNARGVALYRRRTLTSKTILANRIILSAVVPRGTGYGLACDDGLPGHSDGFGTNRSLVEHRVQLRNPRPAASGVASRMSVSIQIPFSAVAVSRTPVNRRRFPRREIKVMPRIRKIIVALVLIPLVLALAPAGARAETRIALVIGNAAYQAQALNTPANDAGLIAQTLQAAGFDVVGARDLDQDTARRAFRDFLDKAAASGPDTVAFVYVSGYGLQLEGENYFVPIDARTARDADAAAEALRISDYIRPLAALKLKATIVVLDAARANPFAASGPPLAGGLALVEPEPGMLIAFNAAPGTVAP